MQNWTRQKTMFATLVWVALLGLTGCGEQMIKPDDKRLEAMIEFEMPDFDSTPENVVQKAAGWLKPNLEKEIGKTEFLSTGKDVADGRGYVTVKSRGDDLTVRFNLKLEVRSGNLIRMTATSFKDMPGPRQGDSDRAYVFFNVVKDAVLEMADELEDHMNRDTREESILDLL